MSRRSRSREAAGASVPPSASVRSRPRRDCRPLPATGRLSGSHPVGACLGAGLFAALILACTPAETGGGGSGRGAASEPPATVLQAPKPGGVAEGILEPGQTHSFVFSVAEGTLVRAVVEQRGVDLVVRLVDPAGRTVIEVDSPTGTQGQEAVVAVTALAGRHLLELSAPGGGTGGYRLVIEDLRTAGPEDRTLARAAAVFAAGEDLRRRGEATSRREAVERYVEAAALYRTLGRSGDEARALQRVGWVHRLLGDRPGAEAAFRRSLELAQAVGDRELEAVVLNGLGWLHRVAGESAKALACFERALDLFAAEANQHGRATALNNLAWVYEALGETQKALTYYRQALAGWTAVGDQARQATGLNNVGELYLYYGNEELALGCFRRALELRRASGDLQGESTTLNSLAKVYARQGRSQEAIDTLRRALALSRRQGDPRGEASRLASLGSLQLETGAGAARSYRDSLALYGRLGEPRSEGYVLCGLGSLHHQEGDAPAALDHYRRALELFRRVRDPVGEAEALLGMARLESLEGDLRSARIHAEEALSAVESQRQQPSSLDLRASYLATHRRSFGFYLDLLMRLHRRHPAAGYDVLAFEVSERSQARSLVEGLAGAAGADGAGEAGLRSTDRVGALGRRINEVDRRLRQQEEAGVGPADRLDLETELVALLLERSEAAARVAAASIRGSPEPLTLREVQEELLDGSTTMLAYALGEEGCYLFRVTAGALESYELGRRDQVEELARRFHLLAAESHLAGRKSQFRLVARELSRTLLGPVAERLGKERLLVVAPGDLHVVPFAALPDPVSGRDEMPWLVEGHELVSLPSASTLGVLRRRPRGRSIHGETLAVLADPVFTTADPRAAARTTEGDGAASRGAPAIPAPALAPLFGPLERLPGTRREAEAILSLVPQGEALRALGFDASPQVLLGGGLDGYRYLHLATHAFLHPRHPELSVLALSGLDPQGRRQEGLVRSHEIEALDLSAELVVLSACKTVIGSDRGGGALAGLPRSFLQAGAGGVVVSLWEVGDAATVDLMERFYRGVLVQGLTPAAALRAAQVRMVGRGWAPYHWAAFVFYGSWEAVPSPGSP